MMLGNRRSPCFFESIFFLNVDLKEKKKIRTRHAEILQIIPIMNNNQDLPISRISFGSNSTVYVKKEKKK